jgi:hypothetical protein
LNGFSGPFKEKYGFSAFKVGFGVVEANFSDSKYDHFSYEIRWDLSSEQIPNQSKGK